MQQPVFTDDHHLPWKVLADSYCEVSTCLAQRLPSRKSSKVGLSLNNNLLRLIYKRKALEASSTYSHLGISLHLAQHCRSLNRLVNL